MQLNRRQPVTRGVLLRIRFMYLVGQPVKASLPFDAAHSVELDREPFSQPSDCLQKGTYDPLNDMLNWRRILRCNTKHSGSRPRPFTRGARLPILSEFSRSRLRGTGLYVSTHVMALITPPVYENIEKVRRQVRATVKSRSTATAKIFMSIHTP
jgi:hypothetical protein